MTIHRRLVMQPQTTQLSNTMDHPRPSPRPTFTPAFLWLALRVIHIFLECRMVLALVRLSGRYRALHSSYHYRPRRHAHKSLRGTNTSTQRFQKSQNRNPEYKGKVQEGTQQQKKRERNNTVQYQHQRAPGIALRIHHKTHPSSGTPTKHKPHAPLPTYAENENRPDKSIG